MNVDCPSINTRVHSKRSRRRCELTVNGRVHDISNLLTPREANCPPLYPQYPTKDPSQEQRTSSDAKHSGAFSRRTPMGQKPVRSPPRPMACPLSERHDGKSFVEKMTSDGQDAQRLILAFFDLTPTVEAIQQQQYTLTCCQFCKTSLACMYGLEYVWCTSCDHFTPLVYDSNNEASVVTPFGVGIGLTHRRILQALELFATEARGDTNPRPRQPPSRARSGSAA